MARGCVVPDEPTSRRIQDWRQSGVEFRLRPSRRASRNPRGGPPHSKKAQRAQQAAPLRRRGDVPMEKIGPYKGKGGVVPGEPTRRRIRDWRQSGVEFRLRPSRRASRNPRGGPPHSKEAQRAQQAAPLRRRGDAPMRKIGPTKASVHEMYLYAFCRACLGANQRILITPRLPGLFRGRGDCGAGGGSRGRARRRCLRRGGGCE